MTKVCVQILTGYWMKNRKKEKERKREREGGEEQGRRER